MLKYVKGVNEETGLCTEVGTGTDNEYYSTHGFTQRDVERAYDGHWYLVGKVPQEPASLIRSGLSDYLYQKKCAVAYTGVTIVKDSLEYLFETGQDSITMCNSQAIAFSTMESTATVDWKVYKNGYPVALTLTKPQFLQIFAFGMTMINSAFGVEGEFNAEAASMTEEQLRDEETIANFKARAESSFGQIPRRLTITANGEVQG